MHLPLTSDGSSRPELLSPAGNWDCVRAAVAAGADAVYFGLPEFNARLRADNFRREELPELMGFLHAHGAKGYVTLNVLIFPAELERALEELRWMRECGVDAVILQDVGLVAAANQILLGLRLHASTQITITSPEGLAWAERLGIEQAVLARECSLRELGKFSTELPLEVFVHGALCVAYSGQCLTSEALGQRSANRGECAQACRMPYELIVDGERVDLGDRRYLLSPQDLAAVEAIPELVKVGIRSFKIEGRLKSAEYVSAITAVYRRALDAAIAGVQHEPTREDWYAMEMTFSRGLFTGWVHGVDHQKLVAARFGKKRGTCVGRVARVGRESVELEPLPGENQLGPLAAGDGVVFDTGGDTEKEQGGRIFQLTGRRVEFGVGAIDWRRVPVGALVWKTDDPQLNRALRKSRLGHLAGHPERKIALNLQVAGRVGQPLGVRASLPEYPEFSAEVFSRQPLLAAEKQPMDEGKLRAALGKLEETPFRLERLEFAAAEPVFLPLAQLNDLRRAFLAELARPREFPPARTSLEVLLEEARRVVPAVSPGRPQLLALCRTEEQIAAAVEEGVATVLLDFEDLRRYGPTLEHWRGRTASRFYLGTPRIQKAGEEGFFKLIERAKPDGVVVRNLGALTYFAGTGLSLLGDFSLNVANPLTAAVFLRDGLERVTASYDLEAGQVGQLAAALPPGRVEVTLHQHMPMFHMEHCVFAAFLSKGKDYTDCGRPCEKHRVGLRDRIGKEHPLRADVGCRNTLFNAVPQSGAGFYEEFLAAGIRHFRVEFLEESESAAREILQTYGALLSGELVGADVWRKLRVQQQLGVTRGPLQARRAEFAVGESSVNLQKLIDGS
jgi:U32 family peptidase